MQASLLTLQWFILKSDGLSVQIAGQIRHFKKSNYFDMLEKELK